MDGYETISLLAEILQELKEIKMIVKDAEFKSYTVGCVSKAELVIGDATKEGE